MTKVTQEVFHPELLHFYPSNNPQKISHDKNIVADKPL